ncbi:glycerophosphoryl diester phosphodiesterase [Maribrevibacterium harenarium]|uniref:Glycerophosphoryl diester phosphodiesterase n=1 Tax=Maribrevibacterium harenarium TaxID=2589817 RepID=A0A501WGA0_9GAMM|nr:glycerophosphoryl diester phosphodiesterase [Maribrevibacterium harenarium]TPE47094.1 glycerophosphoryl diester phosphodiesterase [Maribrevibacterium harenarium]
MLNTKVMGHRGAALLAPENTLASIRAAAATGVTWAEIDVYPLADNGLVIFHDDTLERCTDGTGVTEEAGLDYVLSLHAGKGFANQFAGEKVPSLSEALTCFQELGLGLNLEIKYGGTDVDRVVPLIIEALRQHGFDNNQLMISSFNYEALVKCRALDANLHLAWLCEDIPADWAEKLAAIQAYSLNCDYQLLTESQARAVKAAGYKLLCYTANDPAAVAEHWGWGMDTIITDDPRLFL